MSKRSRRLRNSPKRYDATIKHLIETFPADWLRLGHREADGPIRFVDADLSTISLAADKLMRIDGPKPWMAHLEVQASQDVSVDVRGLAYNVFGRLRHGLPVQTIVVLLRPQADHGSLTGHLRWELPDGTGYLDFRYDVVRVWELDPEMLLARPGTAPLAMIADVKRNELPNLVRELPSKLAPLSPRNVQEVCIAAYVLMGLRYSDAIAAELIRGVMEMEESVTYQAIIAKGRKLGLEQGLEQGREEGREEGLEKGRIALRKSLLNVGTQHLGPPSRSVRARINKLESVDELNRLISRVLSADDWDALLRDA